MRKWLSVSNILFYAVLIFFITQKGPSIWQSFQEQGELAPSTSGLLDINGNSVRDIYPRALIFWATWCGPCDVELARINKMIQDSAASAEQIVAISVDDNRDAILRARQERGYLFPIVWDQQKFLARQFTVRGTPTIVVVDRENKIVWKTMGLSPTLELRLRRYLK